MKAELKVMLIEKPTSADGLAGMAASICAGNGNCVKALDNVIAHDRDGRSWGAINIKEVM